MSIACIIEQEALFAQQIEATLKEIDSRLEVLVFKDLDGFYQWFSNLIKSNESNLKKNSLKLLIGDIQFLGPNYFSLIEKVRKLMVRRGILKQEDDLAVILTTFDSPQMDYRQIESRIITNLLFKPFDRPILKQHLQIALANQKAISESVVFQQKITTEAEMLKEVQLEAYSELGFTTRSNRELKINDVSKYYSPYLDGDTQSSLLARCISCQPHPSFPNEFKAEFRYVGLKNSHIRGLRRSLFTKEREPALHSKISKQVIQKASRKDIIPGGSIHFIVFQKSSTDANLELKEFIEHSLLNATVTLNQNMALFLEALKKNDFSKLSQHPIHAIILSADSFGDEHGLETWSRVQAQIEKFNLSFVTFNPIPKIFLTTTHHINEAKIRSWAGLIEDVIELPLDRNFLSKRLMTLFAAIKPSQESLEILQTTTNDIMRVANPIELTSISEAFLTMKYYRPISFHSFRRFCLPSQQGGETLELLASCYFHEKKDNVYINHFVFFGITDKYLKYIRKWILERYIAGKESAA